MHKSVAQMVPGDVFVGDNDITYIVINSGCITGRNTARPCLRLTHNDHLHVEEVLLDKVGRCIEQRELSRRIRDYQQSTIEFAKQSDAFPEYDGQSKVATSAQRSADEERCWLWLQRFRRAIDGTDPTVMFVLNVEDLTALERTLNDFSRLRNNSNAIHAQLDAARVPHSSLANRVKHLITERDQANDAKVVVDGPRAKYINDALDKAGVPDTFNGNDAILLDRIEWLINQRDRLNTELATTTDEFDSTRSVLSAAGVVAMVDGRRATLPERVAWLIARVGSGATNVPAKDVETASFNEGLARINKALEQLKPTIDAMAAVDKLREAIEQCSQNAATKATTDSHARIESERFKVRAAGHKILRKAWELIQAARVTVGNRDVQRVEPRHEPTSLLDVYQFVQQQHELADRELCSIDENDDGKSEHAAYQRGLATAYVHVMALIAALGTRGFELVQYKSTE